SCCSAAFRVGLTNTWCEAHPTIRRSPSDGDDAVTHFCPSPKESPETNDPVVGRLAPFSHDVGSSTPGRGATVHPPEEGGRAPCLSRGARCARGAPRARAAGGSFEPSSGRDKIGRASWREGGEVEGGVERARRGWHARM